MTRMDDFLSPACGKCQYFDKEAETDPTIRVQCERSYRVSRTYQAGGSYQGAALARPGVPGGVRPDHVLLLGTTARTVETCPVACLPPGRLARLLTCVSGINGRFPLDRR